jgi:prepilin-type N-terminal cleavage/methylation domain-containing protein
VSRTAPRFGFTLIEVVAVVAVLGVLALVAMNAFDLNEAPVVAQADALKAALRYAQSRAMADVSTWGISFTTSGYTLVEDNPNVTGMVLPGQGSATRTLPSGLSLTAPAQILFDGRGQPVNSHYNVSDTAASVPTAYPNNQNITVSGNGGTSVTLTVTAYTGFIP